MINAGPPGSGRQPGSPLFAGPFSIASQNPYTRRGLALLALAVWRSPSPARSGPASWAAATKTTTALHAE